MTEFLVYFVTIACIWSILGLSLNVQFGLAGLVNLGQIVFFMLGAYVSTILVKLAGQPIAVGVVAGIGAAALFGALLALPTARLQQDYWGISTLAAAEIVRLVFLNTTLGSPYVGQAFGVSGIPRPFRAEFADWGLSIADYNLFYMALVLVALAIVAAFVWWLMQTPFGRTLKAMREGDAVPLALGKHVSSFRIRAMAIGGAIGGFAGALFAHYNAYIGPEYFLPVETFLVWAMVILGGAGNVFGTIVGTVIIMAISNSTRFIAPLINLDAQVLGPLRMVTIGILVILVVMFMPRGLVPERRARFER
jgi:branched-chain amino acid transport system permease protein